MSEEQKIEPAAMMIVAGATGAGKDSILKKFYERRPEAAKPITSTTRPPRANNGIIEEHGRDYYFYGSRGGFGVPDADSPTPEYVQAKGLATFMAEVGEGKFFENALVHGNRYGMSKLGVSDVRAKGKLPVVILDVQGVDLMKAQVPCVTVFVSAPMDQLEARMWASRPHDQVPARLKAALVEVSKAPEYDIVLDNSDGNLDKAVDDLVAFYDTVARPRLLAWDRNVEKTGRNKPSR
jgi:guanylate kinase